MVMLNLGTQESSVAPLVAGRVAQDGALHAALDGMDGGETLRLSDGRQLAMIASFADNRGGFCREFQMIADADDGFDHAVACRAASGWSVEIVVRQVAEAANQDGRIPSRRRAGLARDRGPARRHRRGHGPDGGGGSGGPRFGLATVGFPQRGGWNPSHRGLSLSAMPKGKLHPCSATS
jgi:hypothetical protein